MSSSSLEATHAETAGVTAGSVDAAKEQGEGLLAGWRWDGTTCALSHTLAGGAMVECEWTTGSFGAAGVVAADGAAGEDGEEEAVVVARGSRAKRQRILTRPWTTIGTRCAARCGSLYWHAM